MEIPGQLSAEIDNQILQGSSGPISPFRCAFNE
jgi:hypothetical protein